MVAELLSHQKWRFHPPENNRPLFFLYYETSRGQFTKENASRITLYRTGIYRKEPLGAPELSMINAFVVVNYTKGDARSRFEVRILSLFLILVQ